MEYTIREEECGCEVTVKALNYVRGNAQIELHYCPKHKACGDMYKALEELAEYIKFNMGNARPIYEKAIKALSKAEGK